jgi:hypothetical protein
MSALCCARSSTGVKNCLRKLSDLSKSETQKITSHSCDLWIERLHYTSTSLADLAALWGPYFSPSDTNKQNKIKQKTNEGKKKGIKESALLRSRAKLWKREFHLAVSYALHVTSQLLG